METFWRTTPWFGRLILLMATVLFSAIGGKFLANPVQATSAAAIALGSAEAATRIRVGFGAFPISFAALAFACLVSARRLLPGLWMVATVVTIVTLARIVGIVFDGPAAESVKLLKNELVLITLVVVAIVLESLRQRRQPLSAA